ncbi:O-antigen polymerase [Saccharicrinis sp. FJH54]|uniref:O-antigen polymerase n=1 Tax=Saccharicrinis sp. FJH54 TaxID=3344665 RepID=UPI0035D4F982
MIVIVSLILCLFLLLVVRAVVKDIKSPPFILAAIWVIIYSSVFIYWNGIIDLNDYLYGIYFLGLFIFILGFSLIGNRRGIIHVRDGERKTNLKFSILFLQLFFVLAVVFVSLNIYQVYRFIELHQIKFNFWQTLGEARSRGEYVIPFYIAYSRSPVIILTILLGTVYFSNPIKQNKIYFILFLVLSVIYGILVTNRGAIFLLIISLLFSYLYIKNFDNQRLFKIFVRTAIVILSIFILSSFAKFVYQDQSDTVNFINFHLRAYFANPPVAFIEWYKLDEPLKHGTNSFRFFYAIFESFGGPKVEDTVQDYIKIADTKTNVYTIFQYYTADFGLWYSMLVLLILGILYGYLYKKVRYSKEFNIFNHCLLAMLYFPLVYHYFSDTYLSQLSSWIQNIIWLWLFSRREFLFTTKHEKEVIHG